MSQTVNCLNNEVDWPVYRYVIRTSEYRKSLDGSPYLIAAVAMLVGDRYGHPVTIWDTKLKKQVYSTQDSIWNGIRRGEDA